MHRPHSQRLTAKESLAYAQDITGKPAQFRVIYGGMIVVDIGERRTETRRTRTGKLWKFEKPEFTLDIERNWQFRRGAAKFADWSETKDAELEKLLNSWDGSVISSCHISPRDGTVCFALDNGVDIVVDGQNGNGILWLITSTQCQWNLIASGNGQFSLRTEKK